MRLSESSCPEERVPGFLRISAQLGFRSSGVFEVRQTPAGTATIAAPAAHRVRPTPVFGLNEPRGLLRFLALFLRLRADLHRKGLGLAVVGLMGRAVHFITHGDVA